MNFLTFLKKKVLSLLITGKNYYKKYRFQLTAYNQTRGLAKSCQEIPTHPIMQHQFNIRQEADDVYVGLFDHKGMLFLDQFAVDVLELLNGRNSLQQISSITNRPQHEVEEVLQYIL